MTTLRGQLVTPAGLQDGELTFGRSIEALTVTPVLGARRYILPGFIDAHVHGGGGGDTMDGLPGIETLARMHAQRGTTTLLPTTITNPWEQVLEALHAVRQAATRGVSGGADIPGAHLEGPFISPLRLGAQPPETLLPTPERLKEVLDTGIVRAVTLAPELPGALDAVRAFASAGVRVGIGHTAASFEQTRAALDAVQEAGGQSCSTHLYNAMGTLQGREPGVLGALLGDERVFHELILDGHHLHPGSVRLALHCAPGRTTLISDAMRAAGLGDGESELGGQPVRVIGGAARLENGSLAGSVLTLDVALRNALALGLSLSDVSDMLSATPARSLNLHDRGRLEVGLRADVVVLDEAFEVQEVYVAGERVPLGVKA
ncbi:N-acetylglucosamine-6-phosphate deacetylase (plasmid) [Deinococcus sp. KNUC1210]|uniref:N-acetylglucosamine-6-phosphate deacetylase n=1 Tax=Deinococcus sp. KNUC1210 TaxID=2917691 RepID=UPI001EF01A0B|nr:N-acetylglucosamine-6-phosphate deacetylase [Deinococcus sp. KNUC1210]ULH14311.1 N-acetylglucosamine-6-phosphate deacetylase [Deinococcus sp. KNUC1210]